MTNPIRVYIEATDYGVGGQNAVRAIKQLAPTGPGQNGKAVITIGKIGGGYTFLRGDEVRIWETYNVGGAGVLRRLFGGFVMNVDSTTIPKANDKVWELECADYNVLLDALVIDAEEAKTITVPSNASFGWQVAYLVDAIQKQGTGFVAQAIDAAAYVADLWNNAGDPMPAQALRGMTLGAALDVLCANVAAKNTALRPAYHMGQSASFGVGDSCGYATLHVYDKAQAALGVSRYSFTDGSVAGTAFLDTYKRKLEGSGVIERRQCVLKNGKVYTGVATSPVSTPNPYVNHGRTGNKGYWMAEPLEYSDADLAKAPAWITRHVLASQNPRETMVIPTTITDIAPGEVVDVTIANEGLSGYKYMVAGTTTGFPLNKPDTQVTQLQLGQRRLEWWEDGEGQDAVPVVRDIIPPGIATSVAASTIYDPRSGLDVLTITWAAPTDDDLAGYDIHLDRGDGEELITIAALTSYACLMRPSTAYSVFLVAFDTNGNHGDVSTTVTGTSAAVPPTPPPNLVLNGSFEDVNPEVPTQPYGWTGPGSPSHTRDTTRSNAGAASLKLILPSSLAWGAAVTSQSAAFPWIAGEAKSLRVWASADNTYSCLNAYVEFYNRSDVLIEDRQVITDVAVANAVSFAATTVSITAPANTARAFVTVGGRSNAAPGAENLWIDDVSVTPLVIGTDIAAGAVDGTKLAATVTLATGQSIIASGGASAAMFKISDADGTVIGTIAGSGSVGGGNQLVNIVGNAAGVKVSLGTSGILELAGSLGVRVLNEAFLTNGLNLAVQSYSADHTADATETVLLVDATGAQRTITLPAASAASGRDYWIKRINGVGSNVVVSRAGADTIEGATSVTLSAQYAYVHLVSDGVSKWYKF